MLTSKRNTDDKVLAGESRGAQLNLQNKARVAPLRWEPLGLLQLLTKGHRTIGAKAPSLEMNSRLTV